MTISSPGPGPPAASSTRHDRPHPFSRAQPNGLPAYRPLQGSDHRLRHRGKVSVDCATCGWTTPTPKEDTSSWTPSSRTFTGWATIGATVSSSRHDYFEEDYRQAVGSSKGGPMCASCLPRSSRPTGATSASPPPLPTGTVPLRRAWTSSGVCAPRGVPQRRHDPPC